jgi:membrane protein DedA with SNARE-associated domain
VLAGPIILIFSAWTWLIRLGGIGLVLLGFADNSPIPLPGSMDALTIILSAHERSWWPYYAIMATIGGVAGGYMTFAVGRRGGREALEKKIPKNKLEKIFKRFEKNGFWSVFIPGLLPPPVPYSPFLLAAGALSYSPRRFLFAVGLARAIRYTALAYLGSMYSKQIFGFFHKYYKPLFWTLIGLAVIGGAALIWWTVKRKREGKPVIPEPKDKPAKVA